MMEVVKVAAKEAVEMEQAVGGRVQEAAVRVLVVAVRRGQEVVAVMAQETAVTKIADRAAKAGAIVGNTAGVEAAVVEVAMEKVGSVVAAGAVVGTGVAHEEEVEGLMVEAMADSGAEGAMAEVVAKWACLPAA